MNELKWCCELTDNEKTFCVVFRENGLHFSIRNYFTSMGYDTTIPFDVTKGVHAIEVDARHYYNNVSDN